jgi:Tfp pilus assembly protein PilF
LLRRSLLASSFIFAFLPLTGCPGGKTNGGGNGTSGGARPSAVKTDSPQYAEAISAFFGGTIALETSDQDRALKLLQKAVELAPDEPAAHANLALAYLLNNQTDKAAESIKKAHDLAPDSPEIAVAEGVIAQTLGKFDEAMAQFKRASEKDPNNLKILYRIAEVADQQRGPDTDTVRKEMFTRILKARPDNVAALLDMIRLQAQANDKAGLTDSVAKVTAATKGWSASATPLLNDLKKSLDSGNLRNVGLTAARLAGVFAPNPAYRASKAELSFTSSRVGEPLTRVLALPNPSPKPAEPDTALKYTPEVAGGAASVSMAIPPDEKNPAVLVTVSGETLRVGNKTATVKLPGKAGSPPLTRDNLAPFDMDGDYRVDFAVAGPGGLRLLLKKPDGAFADATAGAKLPPGIGTGSYTGVWSVDIEADGDMDLILATVGRAPTVLQNNGDKTFSIFNTPFPAINGAVRSFAWGDIDGDGDPDAMLVGQGGLVVYSNERSGVFKLRQATTNAGNVVAVTVAEVTGDTTLDLVALLNDGSVVAVPDKDGVGWAESVTLVKSGIAAPTSRDAGVIIVADLDNNGGLDLIVSRGGKSEAFLSGVDSKFTAPAIAIPFTVQSVADMTQDGRLDLTGIQSGKAQRAVAVGTKGYKWQNFTLKAAPSAGPDSRINTFCVGGEMEIRTGLLYQKQPLNGPQVHFGLGTYPKVDAARIIWPSGNPQAEFDIKAGVVTAEQRLGGSCPYLFAWNGTVMDFVTDCIWRSPLGLRINAQATAGVTQTEDWVKIRGDQLKPRDGFYDLSITAELRETHFFDLLELMVVDHPEGGDVFVDERFSPAAPPRLEVIPTKTPQPVKQALGTNGQDVTELIRERDARYVDDFGRGQYQGVAKDHYLEVVLPDEMPRGKPVYLIAFGWIHPTDSSINVALGQNPSTAPPQGLSIETPDASGKWTVARPGLGFPEGKVKTVVLRIDDTFKPNAPRRLRLRTNLEIFWDHITWAEALPASVAPLKMKRLPATAADLSYRGFSIIQAKDASSPELPLSYDRLTGVMPRWRDLEGYHTRFGDVKPLTAKTDDRYVIMNAGDELRLRFKELPPPPAGWKRDYILVGDGWVKDGNVNTAFGKTVLPLPAHNVSDYSKPPIGLENDPVYKRHTADWQEYHTRYVAPERFRDALLPRR